MTCFTDIKTEMIFMVKSLQVLLVGSRATYEHNFVPLQYAEVYNEGFLRDVLETV